MNMGMNMNIATSLQYLDLDKISCFIASELRIYLFHRFIAAELFSEEENFDVTVKSVGLINSFSRKQMIALL